MLRAVALRLESGAITWTSSSGILRSSTRRAFNPAAWIPSSLVIRTLIRPPILRSQRLRLGAGLSARLGGGRLGGEPPLPVALPPRPPPGAPGHPREGSPRDNRRGRGPGPPPRP